MPDETETPLTFDKWMKMSGGWSRMLAMYGELGGDIRTLPDFLQDFILAELEAEDKAREQPK